MNLRERGSYIPTARAGFEQAQNALERGDYARAIAELDRAISALKRDGAPVANLYREWRQLAEAACRFPGLGQRLRDSSGGIISLLCLVGRHIDDAEARRAA